MASGAVSALGERTQVNRPTSVRQLIEQIRTLLDDVLELHRQLKVDAVTDHGTGVYNRRYFLQRLSEELERGERYDSVFSLVILDFDDFKEFNDTYGHLAGDQLLRSYAQLMEELVRKPDFVARYGGDEFIILLPGTSREGALHVGDRLLEATDELGEDVPGLSMGQVTYPLDGRTAQELLQRADAALYVAKNEGKHQLVEGNNSQIEAVLDQHYTEELELETGIAPELGGGTPIDAALNEKKELEPETPAETDQAAVTQDSDADITVVRADPAENSVPRKPRGHSLPISVGRSNKADEPVCFWLEEEHYPIEQCKPADIVSATGLDSYFMADTPRGRFLLRRRGSKWFLEAGALHQDSEKNSGSHLA
jgi:diguanylate cyclase (GGDEF)-like protein